MGTVTVLRIPWTLHHRRMARRTSNMIVLMLESRVAAEVLLSTYFFLLH